MAENKIIIIAGPTASGKSRIALAIAQESDAVIINADSMQIYSAIPLLSAQPSAAERALAPHLLYGILPSEAVISAGIWTEMAKCAINDTLAQGKTPLIVGGTGLYLKSLVYGLSPIPDIDDTLRHTIREQFLQLGNIDFHQLLTERDPVMAARLHSSDSQRMMRSMEVLEQTGMSLAIWQAVKPIPFYPREQFVQATLLPPRPLLYANCNSRFRIMVENGALDEVSALLKQQSYMPVMKSLGVPELCRHLIGELTLEEAITQAQLSTRHYAKRQMTWFRHQMPESQVVPFDGTREHERELIKSLLTGNRKA